MWLIVGGAEKAFRGHCRFALEYLPSMGCGGRAVSQLSQGRGKEGMVRVIRGGQLAERLDRIGIEACGVLGAAEVAPVTLRMVRVQAHRAMNPLDSFDG